MNNLYFIHDQNLTSNAETLIRTWTYVYDEFLVKAQLEVEAVKISFAVDLKAQKQPSHSLQRLSAISIEEWRR